MFAAIPETPQHAIKNRPLSEFDTDAAAVRAIAQATVSVELFTIPLYMNSMYSIYGTHQINSKGNKYYKGRQWPGMATTAEAVTANERAFNVIFSVFIQEMLHLQMAANIATAISVAPSFTENSGLQNTERGWICYGPDKHTIPCIVDLRDTDSYKDVRVNLESLNKNQIELFLAIEQPEKQAREELRHNADKYFPDVPLANWNPDKGFADLPLFGTIGYMYECYARYISMEYTDGQTLWQKLFDNNAVQKDMFNVHSTPKQPNDSHPKKEYPHFDTLFGPDDLDGGKAGSQNKAIDMMCAITDQGEGNSAGIKHYRRTHLLRAVQPDYRESDEALRLDYPAYDGDGVLAKSRDASARFHSAAFDHYERFHDIRKEMEHPGASATDHLLTWEQWHAVAGNQWTAAMLTNKDYDAASAPQNIPTPDEVAGALNRLKSEGAKTVQMLSSVSAGAIYGITSVLDEYWTNKDTSFPYPSMVGSGDRMSICWAITGCSPDLSVSVPLPDKNVLYHACQGLDFNASKGSETEEANNQCAAIAVYHSCRGSNSCEAQGGCGFAQIDMVVDPEKKPVLGATADRGSHGICGAPPGPAPTGTLYSAPSDNRCKTYGGCAVPISASQLFPASGTMTLYTFGTEPPHEAQLLKNKNIDFKQGDAVFDTAWAAYSKVMAARHKNPGEMPKPNDLRLALPPST
ncbi:ferritin-like domain-containing protein [Undibacterium sp. Ji49W]|uniref:ferritin-like domain-containing protein n=1 Tax=Undibacterium sp. Ji49W TaxID=3413040 RepID=UPI003BF0EDE5